MIAQTLRIAMLAMMAAPAMAQEIPHAEYRETGSREDWVGIYSPDRGLEKPTSSCAIYSRPKSSAVFRDGARVEVMRGELAAFVSWNGGDVSEEDGEISVMIGVPVVEGADDSHVLTVDGEEQFDLIGVDDRLYVHPEDDAEAIAAIRSGVDMVVTARTREQGVVKDSYSLLGVQDMTDLSQRECH